MKIFTKCWNAHCISKQNTLNYQLASRITFVIFQKSAVLNNVVSYHVGHLK